MSIIKSDANNFSCYSSSSRSSGDSLGILNDGPVVRCLSDAVDTWSKLLETIKSHDISLVSNDTHIHVHILM